MSLLKSCHCSPHTAMALKALFVLKEVQENNLYDAKQAYPDEF